MKTLAHKITIAFLLCFNLTFYAQKRLVEFPFDSHDRAMNVSTAIGVGLIQFKVSSPDVLVQTPGIIADGSETSYFSQFNASYNVTNNNIYIALAPKLGNNVKITHIEFSVRFGLVNSGNAGIFITKDPSFVSTTQLWTCGNNKTFNTYKDFIVTVPDTDAGYSESPNDSIRFAFAQGTNTQGMYLNNFVVYGIVNGETNPAQNIAVNASAITKELANHPSGANACWLMDSDIKWPRTVSNESRFAEMKLGALRFPYGHLADNYLWHTPGQYASVAVTGTSPKVASTLVPYGWSWAVNSADMSFLKDLSFDEFIAICKRQNIEPLIVVNTQSHFYSGTTVTYETLKNSAAEWVRYANITKGYGIKYWQLGNEVDHDGNFTMSTYTDLFLDFAAAMKTVDPTIKTGTGVLLNTSWNEDVLNKAGTLCDFVSAHNYQSGSKVAPGGYRLWYKDSYILITNSKTTQAMLTNNFPNRPEIELHITETNVSGGDFPDLSNIDLYKALYWFEMNMNHLALKNVKYTYYWGTHSPWNGETNIGDIRCMLENSNANTIRPAGRAIQLINTYLKNQWINIERVNGYLRTYASVSSDGKELSLFILNKNLYPEKANIDISNFTTIDAQVEQATFTGTGYNDTNPVITTVQLPSVPSQVTLPPVSLTILNYKRDMGNTTVLSPDMNDMKLSFDGGSLHLSTKTIQQTMLSVYSMDGRRVMTQDVKAGTNRIDLTSMNPGVYFVNLRTGNKMNTIKIVK